MAFVQNVDVDPGKTGLRFRGQKKFPSQMNRLSLRNNLLKMNTLGNLSQLNWLTLGNNWLRFNGLGKLLEEFMEYTSI